MYRKGVVIIVYLLVILISIIVLGLSSYQTKNRSENEFVDLNGNIMTADEMCDGEAQPYMQVVYMTYNDTAAYYGYRECGWRVRNSALRISVHALTILTCVLVIFTLAKQRLKSFIILTYFMTLVGMSGIYSAIVDVIAVKSAYDYCVEYLLVSIDFIGFCQYRDFNSTTSLNFIGSVILFICSVISNKIRVSIFENNGNASNNNNNNNESRNVEQPVPIPVIEKQKSIKLKHNKNKDQSILAEEQDFDNNGSILTTNTNNQYIITNNDNDL